MFVQRIHRIDISENSNKKLMRCCCSELPSQNDVSNKLINIKGVAYNSYILSKLLEFLATSR